MENKLKNSKSTTREYIIPIINDGVNVVGFKRFILPEDYVTNNASEALRYYTTEVEPHNVSNVGTPYPAEIHYHGVELRIKSTKNTDILS